MHYIRQKTKCVEECGLISFFMYNFVHLFRFYEKPFRCPIKWKYYPVRSRTLYAFTRCL